MKLYKVVAISAVVVGLLVMLGVVYHREFTVQGTITGKERIVNSESSHYLVWLQKSDGSTHSFKNSDSLIKWKWDSSDVQGALQEGQEVVLTCYGWRAGFLSMYPNIVAVSP